jgi:hypothetical protein
MKEELCKAFCDELMVTIVPAGMAVTTPFAGPDGDHIGFYVVKEGDNYRIEDDGVTLPYLEASGVEFGPGGTRGDALTELLSEYGVSIDVSTQEFFIGNLSENELPAASLKFVAFSLHVRDFMLVTDFRIATTFREDAAKLLREAVSDRAALEENAVIMPSLAEFPADFVLRAPSRPPVGVYLGMSDTRVLEAFFMHMNREILRARHELREECSIVALIEKARSLSSGVRQQAMNRLDAVTEFRGDEIAAVEKIAREAIGDTQIRHQAKETKTTRKTQRR